jgi:hypothetical protein
MHRSYIMHGTGKNACKFLVGKSEGKRPRRRWKDDIKMDFRETEWDNMDYIHLVQDRD